MLGSAFTPPLLQCEAAARAACCSHRSPQNKDTESPSGGFRILQLCSSTRSYPHQHAHSCCPSSPLDFYLHLCLFWCVRAFASHSQPQTCSHVIWRTLFPVCVLALTVACGHTSGGLSNKTSSSMKPQPTSRSPLR